MDLKALVITLTLVWIAIHGLSHLLNLLRSRPSLLPAPFLRSRRPSAVWHSPSFKVVLQKLHIRVETTALNSKHSAFVDLLARNQSWARRLMLFYDLGAVFGVLGMIGSLGLLMWSYREMGVPLLNAALREPPNATYGLVGRSLTSASMDSDLVVDHKYTRSLKPIVSLHSRSV